MTFENVKSDAPGLAELGRYAGRENVESAGVGEVLGHLKSELKEMVWFWGQIARDPKAIAIVTGFGLFKMFGIDAGMAHAQGSESDSNLGIGGTAPEYGLNHVYYANYMPHYLPDGAINARFVEMQQAWANVASGSDLLQGAVNPDMVKGMSVISMGQNWALKQAEDARRVDPRFYPNISGKLPILNIDKNDGKGSQLYAGVIEGPNGDELYGLGGLGQMTLRPVVVDSTANGDQWSKVMPDGTKQELFNVKQNADGMVSVELLIPEHDGGIRKLSVGKPVPNQNPELQFANVVDGNFAQLVIATGESPASLVQDEADDFVPIEISKSLENPTEITMDDLTSGRLAKSEALYCGDFSNDMVNSKWKLLNDEPTRHLMIDTWSKNFGYDNPATRPQKICSVSEFPYDWGNGPTPTILIGMQVQDKEGNNRFLHFRSRPEDAARFIELSKTHTFGIMIDLIKADPAYPEKEITLSLHDDWDKIATELINGNFPSELETRILTSTAAVWYRE